MNRPMRETHMEMIAVAIAALVACGFVFYLAGELLTYLATGHGTGMGWMESLGLSLRVPFHIKNPVLAWPEETRAIFRPLTFWILAGLMIWGILWAAQKTGLRFGRLVGRWQKPESAKMAAGKDLERLIVPGPTPGRITLGKLDGKLLAAEPSYGALVVGPPGSRKTTSLITPIITQWEGPVIATSMKADILVDTIALRRKKGNAMIFDPGAAVGSYRRNSWSPLARCNNWGESLKTAGSMVNSAKQATGGSSENEIWYKAAQNLLAPFLFAASLGGHDVEVLLQWLDAQDYGAVRSSLLENLGESESRNALVSLQGVESLEPQQRSSIFFTAINTLEAYRNPSVLDSARTCEIHPESFFNGEANTLYVAAPPHEQKALRSPFTTLILSFLHYAYDENLRTGKPLDPPLLVALDELANIAPIEELDEFVTTARGVGIQFVSILQDVGQLRHRWGESRAQTLLSAHQAKLILPGISDEHTFRWINSVTGDQEIRQVSYTDGHQSKSSTDSTTYRPLLPANLVREQKRGHAILIYDNLPPISLKLNAWFEDRKLAKLINDAKENDPERIDPSKPIEIHGPADDVDKPAVVVQAGKPKQIRVPGTKRLAHRDELAAAVLHVAAHKYPYDAYKALEAVTSVTSAEAYKSLGKRSLFEEPGRGAKDHYKPLLVTLDLERQVRPAVYAQTDALWPQLAPAGLPTPDPEPVDAPRTREVNGCVIDAQTGEVLFRRAPKGELEKREPAVAAVGGPAAPSATAVLEPETVTQTSLFDEPEDLRAGEYDPGAWPEEEGR